MLRDRARTFLVVTIQLETINVEFYLESLVLLSLIKQNEGECLPRYEEAIYACMIDTYLYFRL